MMKGQVMTTGTSSRPERIEETKRIEALKKKFAEDFKANRATGIAKAIPAR